MNEVITIDNDLGHIQTALAFIKTEELRDSIQNAVTDFINESKYEDVLNEETGEFELIES